MNEFYTLMITLKIREMDSIFFFFDVVCLCVCVCYAHINVTRKQKWDCSRMNIAIATLINNLLLCISSFTTHAWKNKYLDINKCLFAVAGNMYKQTS